VVLEYLILDIFFSWLLVFKEDGFVNSTRAYYTCKYFDRSPMKTKIYNTPTCTNEDVSNIPGYMDGININKINISDTSLEKAKAIYEKNKDEIIKYFADEKPVQTDPSIANIDEIIEIAKMSDSVCISDFAKKCIKIDEENPYE